MARRTSYNPNTALIAGEAKARKYQSGFAAEGAQAFAKGFLTTYEAGIKEKEERDAEMESWMTALGSPENINMLDDGYNKQVVTNFVREKRDEYAELAGIYKKTKDPEVMDRMNSIKFSFVNLNNQLKGLVEERKMYADTYDKGQLVVIGNGDEKYTDIYTNKGDFSIETNGDIGFTSNGEYNKFTDIAGKWNVENNIHKTHTLKTNLQQTKAGAAGKDFIRDNVKNSYLSNIKETGSEGIMVMSVTDMSGDGKYVVGKDDNGNDIVADDMSFKSMWSTGFMDEKFYEKIPKGSDPKWMLDKNNVNHLADLISEYNTDVTEFLHSKEKTKYDAKQQASRRTTGKPANFIIGGQTFNARDFNNSFVPFINKLIEPSEGETFVSPTGMKFKFEKGKYYIYDPNTKKIDDDNPMTFNDIAVADGWANYLTDDSNKTTGGGAADSL